jgi:hypothetical protein
MADVMRLSRAQLPFLLLLCTSRAFAQSDVDINAAYQYAAEGLSAFEAEKYTESLNDFARAYSIVKLPSLALYMARANIKLGHLLAAKQLYTQTQELPDGLGDPEVQQNARQAASTEIVTLQSRIPRLVVQVPGLQPESLVVQIDGIAVPASQAARGWQVDPGPHQVAAAFGNQRRDQQAALPEGETRVIVLTFEPPPTPVTRVIAPPTIESSTGTTNLRTAGWVSLGIGGAALAVWGTTGIWALWKRHQLNRSPGTWDANHCESATSKVQDCETYDRLGRISTIGFYTGLIGVATGGVLLWAVPSRPGPQAKAATISPLIGLGYAGVQGEFE